MKVAIYPGSFNPWHEGHTDILKKSLKIFDQVIVAVGINPEKSITEINLPSTLLSYGKRVRRAKFTGLLKDFVNNKEFNACAIVRGLRNGQDMEFERAQQYWNEDLGIVIPTIYIICDRKLVHISSSAIRQIEAFKK